MNPTITANMSAELITVFANDTIELAQQRMQACNIRHLPVRGLDGSIVGILSDRDVLKAAPARGARVENYMSWPVRTFDADDDLRAVAQQMIDEKLSSFLVTRGRRIVGIITTEDMLRVLVDLLRVPENGVRRSLHSVLDESSLLPI